MLNRKPHTVSYLLSIFSPEFFWPLTFAVRVYTTGEGEKKKNPTKTQKPNKRKTKAPTNISRTHPTSHMKALAGCKDDKIIAASEPACPCCSSFAENSDLRVPHQNIPDPHVFLSSAAINNMCSMFSVLGGFFVAFLKFYKKTVCFLWHLLSYLILYSFKRKDKILCPCWRLVVTRKQYFFLPTALTFLCANAVNIQSV